MSSTDYSKELAKMFQNDSFAQAHVNAEHVPPNFEVSRITQKDVNSIGNLLPSRKPPLLLILQTALRQQETLCNTYLRSCDVQRPVPKQGQLRSAVQGTTLKL
jgi:hypothetical protein